MGKGNNGAGPTRTAGRQVAVVRVGSRVEKVCCGRGMPDLERLENANAADVEVALEELRTLSSLIEVRAR